MRRVVFILFFICAGSALAQITRAEKHVIDSLKQTIGSARHDSIVVKACRAWDNIIYTSDPETDLALNKKIHDISQKQLKRKLNFKEKKFFTIALAEALNCIGVVHQEKGNYPEALENYFASLKIKEKIQDKTGIAIAYNNIGNIYSAQKNKTEALKNYFASLKISEQIKDTLGIAISYNNLGTVYTDQGNYTQAMKYFFASLKMKEILHDSLGMAWSNNNIGNIFYKLGNYPEAIKHCMASLKTHEQIGNKEGMAFAFNNLGNIALTQGKKKEARSWYEKGLHFSQQVNSKHVIGINHLGLARADSALGNYKSALENYRAYYVYRDSLINEENAKKGIQQQMQYEFNKKEAAAKAAQEKKDLLARAEQEKKDEINAAEKKRQFIVILLVSCVLAIVIVFAFFIFRSLKITRKQKIIIEEQKHLVEEKHKEITDSINYAERIQKSFLATQTQLSENLQNYFVLFQPKDVVSGDFYWSAVLHNGNFALACADSTGHGVPGAIMSILNISSLEKAIEKENEPSQILNATRKLIIERLKKDGSAEGGKDGMDCSLLCFDFNQMKLEFALANNPLWMIRNGSMIEFSPDKMPVGKHDKDQVLFKQQEFELQKGDMIYALTDGYPDQFGGPKGKKFKYANLQKLLLEIHGENPEVQKSRLHDAFTNWKGDLEQVDDVCVIGIRI